MLVLLALAADREGASFYGRERMAIRLGTTRAAVDRGLSRLLALGLVAHRPWRLGGADGVWQLVPLPAPLTRSGPGAAPLAIAELLVHLGYGSLGPGSAHAETDPQIGGNKPTGSRGNGPPRSGGNGPLLRDHRDQADPGHR